MTTHHQHQAPEQTIALTGALVTPDDPFELLRLQQLDLLINRLFPHPLTGLPSALVARLGTVLDLACGSGGWVLDVAFSHPQMEVAGLDRSQGMIAAAKARARTQHLDNASFGVMDIHHPIDFPDGTFDLINGRFLGDMLTRTQWRSLLSECARLLKPGGVMRLTEREPQIVSTSRALIRLDEWLAQALHQAGYGFAPSGESATFVITPCLPALLEEAGFEDLQLEPYVFDCSAHGPERRDGFSLTELTIAGAASLICEQGLTSPEAYAQTWEQAAREMRSADFCGLLYGVTAWGFKHGEEW